MSCIFMHKSSLLLFSCVFAPDTAMQFGARAHRGGKKKTQRHETRARRRRWPKGGEGGTCKCILICVKNGQLHWQRHQQCAIKLAQKVTNTLDTGPTGKVFHSSPCWLVGGIVVAQQRQQIQQESIDRWPDS